MRNLFLDATRGMLAWIVVLVHAVYVTSPLLFPGVRAMFGTWAVSGFILLAGYSAVRYYRAEPYPRYLLAKALRILPALFASMLLCIPLKTTLAPGWFVVLLAQFYLVFPGIMWCAQRYGAPLTFSTAGIIGLLCTLPPLARCLAHLAPLGMGELLPQNLGWFAVGMLLAVFIDRERFESDLSGQFQKDGLLVKSGERSYALFLIHWPILVAIGLLLLPEVPNALRLALIVIVGFPAAWLGAGAVMHGIELPMIRIAKQKL